MDCWILLLGLRGQLVQSLTLPTRLGGAGRPHKASLLPLDDLPGSQEDGAAGARREGHSGLCLHWMELGAKTCYEWKAAWSNKFMSALPTHLHLLSHTV